jgi:hypothetical protein
MKKTILLLVLILFAGISQAQLLRGMGIKAGLTFANQDWNHPITDVGPDSRAGFNLGIFAEFFDMPLFSVVGELNYVQKGVRNIEGQIAETLLGGNIRLNYLNISALAKLRIDYPAVSPYIVAGPKLDIELNRDAAVENIIVNNFNKERLGFKLGVGTEIRFPALTMLAELIYDADFNELYNSNNLSINTKAYDLRIGIMF